MLQPLILARSLACLASLGSTLIETMVFALTVLSAGTTAVASTCVEVAVGLGSAALRGSAVFLGLVVVVLF